MFGSHGHSEESANAASRSELVNSGKRQNGNHSVTNAVTGTIALRFTILGDLPIVLFLNGTEPMNRKCDNGKA